MGERDREERRRVRRQEEDGREGEGKRKGRGRKRRKDFLNIHTAGNGPEHSQDSRIQAGVPHAVRDPNI